MFTFQFHAALKTLVETTCRTLLARRHRNRTDGASQTHVVFAILDGSLEETLTRFTAEDAVMEPRDFITTDRTWTVMENGIKILVNPTILFLLTC